MNKGLSDFIDTAMSSDSDLIQRGPIHGKKATHTGMITSNEAGKRRVDLVKSGKYWKTLGGTKFDQRGVAFGLTTERLQIGSIKELK